MIHVCFALYDPCGTYSKYLGAAVCSLFVNVGDAPVTVHILHDDTLSDVNRERFEHLAYKYHKRIVFHYIDTSEFQSVKHLVGNFTVGTLFRLKISEAMPDDLDKIIYLDCDLIVHLDIAKLWEMKLDHYYIAACIDPDETVLQNKWLSPRKKTEYDHYFNAGVLVINLKQIRLLGDFFQICMDFFKEHPDVKLADQDALNFICFGHVLYLEKKYNLFSRKILDLVDDNMPAGIYHISGESVNWESNRNVDRLFMHYLLLTEWGTGSEIYPYMQSWVACEAMKFSAMQSLMKRVLHEDSLKIILFGANSILLDKVEQLIPQKRMAYILDNNRAVQGGEAHGLPVYAPAHLAEERKGSFVVIVMSKKYYDVISRQLSGMGLTENTDFYDARSLLSESDSGYYQENRIRGFC